MPRGGARGGRQPRARGRRDARLLRRRGAPAVLPADRAAAAADLAEAQLACGDADAAERTLEHVERPPPVRSAAQRLLARSRAPAEAPARPGGSRAREARPARRSPRARARLAEGRALAAAGQREAAIEALVAAEAAFDGFGALRRRDEAVRELRRLGHRVLRAAGARPRARSPR